MQDPRQTIEQLYTAFARLDGPGMQACYATDARFDDEAFSLRGARQIGGMWSMLTGATRQHGADVFQVKWRDVRVEGSHGQAHWDARYRFSATGRLVHNAIDSSFVFTPEGLIARQVDTFDFWRWSRQALGTPGLLLGWSPMLRAKVRATAARNLQAYLARTPDDIKP